MAARAAGRNAEAAALFAGFIARYPADPRAQDAAYMRILSLQAAGQAEAMRAAANAYLRAYPNGFRRAEAEELSR
jgi:outer membrane protein assembly factor BamD (BamD/ComL family)